MCQLARRRLSVGWRYSVRYSKVFISGLREDDKPSQFRDFPTFLKMFFKANKVLVA